MKVLLFSGGLDSVLAWHRERPDRCVHVLWGAPYEDREAAALVALRAAGGPAVDIIQGPQLADAGLDGHVPHRNLALLTTAAAHYPGADLLIGSVLGESSADKSGRFRRLAGRSLSASENRRVRVRAPLARRTKRAHVRAYLAAGGDPELLAATTSCYEGSLDLGCGRCPACFRRWQALDGLVDYPTLVDPATWWTEATGRGAAAALGRLRESPVAGWPGIVWLNLDAWRRVRARQRAR